MFGLKSYDSFVIGEHERGVDGNPYSKLITCLKFMEDPTLILI